MSTAIYYPEERHSLPSLSTIMNNSQSNPHSEAVGTGPVVNGSVSGNDELFSTHGSQPSTANTTPASSFSGKSTGNAAGYNGGFYGDAGKCTCKSNANRIPRPRNAFILFRQKYHQCVLDEGTVIRTNPEVSRELGRRWRALGDEERDHWNQLAEEEKTNHAKKYPGYRYTPRRNGKNKFCDFCKQKNLRQQQMQLHNQQLLQMQQDQYASYLLQQQPQPQHHQPQMQTQMQGAPHQPQMQGQMQTQMPQYQQQMPLQQIATANAANAVNANQTPQGNNASMNMQQPYGGMLYIPSNPIQSNFQFQYNNEMIPSQDKLSPLSQVPSVGYEHYHHGQTQTQPQPQAQAQPQPGQPQGPQFAIGYDQQRFNALPTPINSNLANSYGFEGYQS